MRRWLTVVSPEAPDGMELLLEPDAHPAAGPFKRPLVAGGIPFTSCAVDDRAGECERPMARGVAFTRPPVATVPVTTLAFDDTCGNLMRIASVSG